MTITFFSLTTWLLLTGQKDGNFGSTCMFVRQNFFHMQQKGKVAHKNRVAKLLINKQTSPCFKVHMIAQIYPQQGNTKYHKSEVKINQRKKVLGGRKELQLPVLLFRQAERSLLCIKRLDFFPLEKKAHQIQNIQANSKPVCDQSFK